MNVLEKVVQMKNQGTSDEDIVQSLQEQGISPKEINNALSKEKIKSAISDDKEEGMEQSIMATPAPLPSSNNGREGGYSIQQTKEIPEHETIFSSEQAYSPEYYQEDYGYQQTSSGTDLIIEVAEQVFSEKIKKIQKQVENFNEFKTLAETRIENISERLKKMESIIDKLQIAILEKIGNYGKNIEGIKNEMSMMQDSFGKIINPLLDKAEHHVSAHHHLTHKPAHKNSKKKS